MLQSQYLVRASSPTKIRLSLLATALVDALGGPAEFSPRFSFPFINSMIPNKNFGLPPGIWTDDTSMTLCLARSLATYMPRNNISTGKEAIPGGFDEAHQLDMYHSWRRVGYLSAIGKCFDIGNTTRSALSIWSSNPLPRDAERTQIILDRIRSKLSGESSCGNGSLMRVLPVGLAFWRDEDAARKYALRSSDTTHPNPLCGEACQLWTTIIVKIMQKAVLGESDGQKFTKLDLLTDISAFP